MLYYTRVEERLVRVKNPIPVRYRSVICASQRLSWFVGQLLRVRYSIRAHRPQGVFQREDECCLILAPTHQTIFDPWLLACALSYRRWRALLPIRILATQSFRGAMRWFKPLIRILYRLGGVVELPPKDREDIPMAEKVRGLIEALKQGEIVMIFPEGGIGKPREPPIGKFAHGVVYVHRASGALIVPIAVWIGQWSWLRRRYSVRIGHPVRIPEELDLDAGAEWLRQRALELHEQAREGNER
jgi:1-acyl-sn-glycerol-3-phosphate acyltransferase